MGGWCEKPREPVNWIFVVVPICVLCAHGYLQIESVVYVNISIIPVNQCKQIYKLKSNQIGMELEI